MDSVISLKQKLPLNPPRNNNGTEETIRGGSVFLPTESSSASNNNIEDKKETPSLVALFKNGDESAFRTLIDMYQWRLYCSAIKILKSRDDALDAVAQTFAIAFKERKKFREESAIYTYLWKICFSVCYHTAVKIRRQGAAVFSLDENTQFENNEANVRDSYNRDDNFSDLFKEGKPRFLQQPTGNLSSVNNTVRKHLIKSTVRNAISKLPKHHRQIVILKDFYDYSYEEISRILSIPRGTVMSRLSRARSALKETLKDLF